MVPITLIIEPFRDLIIGDHVLHVGLDPEALRNPLTRKPVIVPARTGELVKLELGAIDLKLQHPFRRDPPLI